MAVSKTNPGVRTGGWPRARGRLARAARVAVEDVLRVKRGERVVVITNPEDEVWQVASAVYSAALARGAEALLAVQPRCSSLDLATDAVIHALRSEPQVIASISAEKLGKDRFGLAKPYRYRGRPGSWTHIFNALLATERARAFWSPSVTLDMFTRTVPIDYALLRRRVRRLKRALDPADRVQITAPGGTDIEIGLAGRTTRTDDGAFHRPGSGGNLPAGEAFISPANYDAEGVLVFDGSLAVADGGGAFVPRRPVTVEVAGGRVTAVRGGAGARRFGHSLELGEQAARKMRGQAGWTTAKVDSYVHHARHLGELGIGLNPAARVTGNMLEDEKILGTCHIAIGSNYDNDAEAFIHLDCIVRKPTITVLSRSGRRRTIMRAGKLEP